MSDPLQVILEGHADADVLQGQNKIPSEMERLRSKEGSHLGARRKPRVSVTFRPQRYLRFANPQHRGANDALAEYWASIGGKPVAGEKPQKKRGRQSGSIKPEPETKAKKQRNNKGARSEENGRLKQDVNPPPTVGFAEVGDDDWKPPPVKDGSWDPLVQSVDTVVRENSDGELWGYLIWNEQSAAGRYHRSKAKLPAIYKACPQRMLHFYEKHLYGSMSSTLLRRSAN